jgi:adenosylhomocysteine nucleosidase
MVTSIAESNFKTAPSCVLVVAAIKRELTALAREPRAGLELIETGEGPRNASRILQSRLEQSSPRAVINIGMAGSLSPELRVGDLVIAREARAYGESFAQKESFAEKESFPEGQSFAGGESFDASQSPLFRIAEQMKNVRSAIAITIDEIVGEAQTKRRLAERLGKNDLAWVDMESAAIASLCERLKIPYLIARCISDAFDEDLPLDFNRCRASDGRVSPRKVMQSAILKPRAFKRLIELKRRSDVCADRLGAFVRDLLPHIR